MAARLEAMLGRGVPGRVVRAGLAVLILVAGLIRGPIADWYPFLDPAEPGGDGAVTLYSLLILLFFIGVGAFLHWWASAARGPMQLAAARVPEVA